MDRDTADPSVTLFPGAKAEQWIRYQREFAAPSTSAYEFGCGQRLMRPTPPLDVTEREITLGAELLLEAIEDMSAKSNSPTDPTTLT